MATSGVAFAAKILGEVKTVEDLAGLVPDDLRGWFEVKNGERVRETGVLESFSLSPDAAEAIIMNARVAMGWVEAEPEPELELEEIAADEGEEDGEAIETEAVAEEG